MKTLASEIHSKFALKLGPDDIASPKALRIIDSYLLKFLNISSFQNSIPSISLNTGGDEINRQYAGSIVEIGSGIGTITDLLQTRVELHADSFQLICYEINEWCIDQLQKNLKNEYILCRDISKILDAVPTNIPVFLVIDEHISKSQTKDLLKNLNVKFVIIEGHRFIQRKDVGDLLFGTRYHAKFYGNSFDSVKGAAVYTINPGSNKYISHYESLRFEIQSNLQVRRILQFCGIRKRLILKVVNKFLNPRG